MRHCIAGSLAETGSCRRLVRRCRLIRNVRCLQSSERLAVLSRGRAVSNSPSPMPMHACPEAEACDTEGLVLEFVSIGVERGERCPLLLCRAAPTSAPSQGAAAVTGDTAAPGAADAPLRPVFVLHGTGKSLTDLLRNGHLQRFARAGLLAVYAGTGVQVLGCCMFTMVFAVLGFLSPSNRGGLMSALLLLFVLSSALTFAKNTHWFGIAVA